MVQQNCWHILSCTSVNIADIPNIPKISQDYQGISGFSVACQVHLLVNPSGDAKKLMRTEADDSGLELCTGQQICNGRLDA